MKLYINIFEEIKGVKAFFSTKHGASNGSPYYNADTLQQLGLTDKVLVQPQQVHEAKIGIIGTEDCRIVDEEGKIVQTWDSRGEGPVIDAWMQGGGSVPGNPELKDCPCIRLPRTDGIITDRKDVLLTTVHADCLPVWFYDEEHHAIGLVHAGWRGTLAGIAPKAVKLMEKTYGSDPAKMKAAIGPGISLCCFETGPEVIEAFRKEYDFADDYAEPKGEKYYIDLKGIVKEQLTQTGINEANLEISPHCTCCEAEMFASYRREGGTYMRMGAGISLE